MYVRKTFRLNQKAHARSSGITGLSATYAEIMRRYEHLKSIDPVSGKVQHRFRGGNGKVPTKMELAKELQNAPIHHCGTSGHRGKIIFLRGLNQGFQNCSGDVGIYIQNPALSRG